MHPLPPSRRRASAAAFLPALAAGAAASLFAAHQVDPHAAAETAYLALLATALLAAVAAVEAAPVGGRSAGRGPVAAAAAVLAVLALWSLPAGPLRGAAVPGLLVAALAVAAARRLTAPPGGATGATAAHPRRGETAAALALTLPLALAIQVLVRADRLLAPEPGWRLLAGLLGLPAVAALATAFLLARAGRAPALVAAATAALLGPGFTVPTAGALVALAGAEAMWRPRTRAERWAGGAAAAAGALAAAAVEPWAAAVVALAMALASGSATAAAIVGLAALVALVALPESSGWSAGLPVAATTVAPLAPVVALAAVSRSGRRPAAAAVAAALLALAAARLDAGLALLAAPLAALPLAAGRSLADRPAGERHALFAPQVVWSAALLGLASLAAAYPWLRPRPFATALGVFGLAGSGWAPAVVAVVAGLAAWGGLAAETGGAGAALGLRPRAAEPRPHRPRPIAPRVAAAAAAATLVVAAGLAAVPWRIPPLVLVEAGDLDAEHPRLVIELPPAIAAAGGTLRAVAETSLSHAVTVPAGQPVARISLAADRGSGAWTLRAGRDTAEWAIRRPDVAAAAAHAAPEPWLARVAAERFFGLVYRSRASLPAPAGAGRLVVERDPALPPDAVVHLHRLEVRR